MSEWSSALECVCEHWATATAEGRLRSRRLLNKTLWAVSLVSGWVGGGRLGRLGAWVVVGPGGLAPGADTVLGLGDPVRGRVGSRVGAQARAQVPF